MIPTSEWIIAERPGWFGEAREQKIVEYDAKYGKENWRIRHQLGPRVLDLTQALQLYEISYEIDFLNPDRRYLWTDLMNRAKDVWTEEESDIDSGLDYRIQKAKAVHYEDMSIRIILLRHGQHFKGNKLIRVRADSDDVVGKALSSIHIPFVFPNYIEYVDCGSFWWNRHKGSLEHFWHANKILQVRK